MGKQPKANGVNKLQQCVEEGWTPEISPEILQADAEFRVKISPAVRQNINRCDGRGPVMKQFIPDERETQKQETELTDPIGDNAYAPVKGIIHRYPDRVLLLPTNLCAVHCRYCFRRGRIGKPGGELKPAEIEKALQYIHSNAEIWEVILSGGDPLILSDRRLDYILKSLRKINHVKVLRVHTRMPVVAPERITRNLARILRGKKKNEAGQAKPLYLMLHCNHAKELTREARSACAMLADEGIPLLSQSVLLKGVNDADEPLRDLVRALVETRIKPHYLHHGDLAEGTAHFRTTIAEGQALLRKMRGNISGLCQPTYMLDLPGGHGKIPVGPEFIRKAGDGYLATDYQGKLRAYMEAHLAAEIKG